MDWSSIIGDGSGGGFLGNLAGDATKAYTANQQSQAQIAYAQAAAAQQNNSLLANLNGPNGQKMLLFFGMGLIALFVVNQANK